MQVSSLATRRARVVELDGISIDCRERVTGGGTTYSVVTGDIIATELPWLMNVYKVDVANFVSKALARAVIAANNDRYGVNINVVQGLNARYEWHVDPSPVAAVLFTSAHNAGDGGELGIREAPDQEPARIYPRPGLIVAFEGRKLEHAVLPLRRDVTRISIPMLYYDVDELQYFPKELDNYLYGIDS
jgi:hypothetical protein